MRRLHPQPGLRARGFSLFEMILAVALTATILTLGLQWVSSLITTSSTNLASASTDRTVTTVAGALDTDLTSLVACPATATPIATATTGVLAVFTSDPVNTAQVDLVTWTVTGTTLTRSFTPATLTATACGPTDPTAVATSAVYATDVHVDGTVRDATIGAFTSQNTPGAGAVSVALTFTPPDPTQAPAALTRSYPLYAAYSGLS